MNKLIAERIDSIALDDQRILKRTPEIEHERRVAIADLLESNEVHLVGDPVKGPYDLFLSVKEERLLLIFSGKNEAVHEVTLSLKPLRGTIKDYFLICESYYDAIRHAPGDRIQTLDMARRGVHNEGSEQLQSLLASALTTDFATARRLFTLICVLHIK